MPADPQASGEIVNARVLPCPRERVWDAFRDPTALAAWWGPNGFTNTFHEFDFRSGGSWKFTMRGANDILWPMNHQFLEIVRPERVVVRHSQGGHDFTLTITLRTCDRGTELLWRQRFDDAAEGERLRAFLAPANDQNLDRLAAFLSQYSSETKPSTR